MVIEVHVCTSYTMELKQYMYSILASQHMISVDLHGNMKHVNGGNRVCGIPREVVDILASLECQKLGKVECFQHS